jgi:Bardet-Biedl syndrome 1 protein
MTERLSASLNDSSAPAVKKSSPWLSAWHDPLARIKAYSGSLALADLQGDGDCCLLIADQDKRLKVYRGTSFAAHQDLLEQPCALVAFHTDSGTVRTPSIAIAAGSHVYIYRNLRPYYKFTTPAVEPAAAESTAWASLTQQSTAEVIAAAIAALLQARDAGARLSARSANLLATDSAEGRAAVLQEWAGLPLATQPAVTAMTKLKRSREDADAGCCLVIGTEAGQVLILEPPGGVITQVTLPSPPAFMEATGLFEVEWRVIIACRNGKVYTVKNGEGKRTAVVTGTVLDMETLVTALAREAKLIHVATMDCKLHCFHLKGRRQHCMLMPSGIAALEPFSRQGHDCLLVALDSGAVRLYNGKSLLHTLELGAPPLSLRFGRFGREDSALTVVLRGGALSIKILDRRANLGVSTAAAGPPAEQDIPLPVPKKTRLYVEQTQREREQAGDMHRAFQKDLCRLRLRTARAYVDVITGGEGSSSSSSSGSGSSSSGGSCGANASLRLHAECQGLGPHFKLRVSLLNGGARALVGCRVAFAYPAELYRLEHTLLQAPVLLPSVLAHVVAEVECVDPAGIAGAVRVMVLTAGGSVAASAVLQMPASELGRE